MKSVAVIMGGPSHEHEVSLKSGTMITKALARNGIKVFPAIFTKSMKWTIYPPAKPDENILSIPEKKDISAFEFLSFLHSHEINHVFPALHGPFGEDGTLQGFFKTAGIKFTGNDVGASAVSMNKLLTKKILKAEGIPTPDFIEINKSSDIKKLDTLGLPVVLKAPEEGSSFGLTIAKNKDEIHKFINEHLSNRTLLAEQFVKGREFTCGVLKLDNETLEALPPTEIIPRISEYFDFKAKYADGGSLEITPAEISEELTLKIKQTALKVHKALGMGVISRTDFITDSNETLYVLEVNSMPGFTANSLFPKAAAVYGMSFDELVMHILKISFK